MKGYTTMRTMTATQIADLHAARTAKGTGYAPSLAECIEAARAGRLYDVDTQSSGYDGLEIGDDVADVLTSWADACDAEPRGWSAEQIELSEEPDREPRARESVRAFLYRCAGRAPRGWDVQRAVETARVISESPEQPGHIVCARDGVYLCAEGYPAQDEDGVEWWPDPASWVFWLSREDQRRELLAAC